MDLTFKDPAIFIFGRECKPQYWHQIVEVKSWSSDRSGWYTIKFFYKLENWRRRECCWKQESQIKIRLFGSWDYWKEIPFTIEAIITTFWAFMTAFLLFWWGTIKSTQVDLMLLRCCSNQSFLMSKLFLFGSFDINDL